MNYKKLIIFLLVFMPSLVYCDFTETLSINTPHFRIAFPSYMSQDAAYIATEAEQCIVKIINFFEYSPGERINIIITDPAEDRSFFKQTEDIFAVDTLIINPVDKELSVNYLFSGIYSYYIDSFTKFYKIRKLLFGTGGNNIFKLLEDYILYGVDDSSLMVLNDIFINKNETGIVINETGIHNCPEYRYIFRFFLRFAEEQYGRNIVVQSFKDSSFYGSFYKALSENSGIEFKQMSDDFTAYVARYISNSETEKYNYLYDDDNRFFSDLNVISDCYSSNDKTVYTLGEMDDTWYIVKNNLNMGDASAIRIICNGVFFTSIAAYNYNNEVVLGGFNTGGSIIAICNIKTGKILRQIQIPFIFIRYITTDTTGQRIFISASAGGRGCLLAYDWKEIKVLKTGESGLYFENPFCTASGTILYVYKNSIVEYTLSSGSAHKLYTSTVKIGSPYQYNGDVYFTEICGGKINISAISGTSGEKKQLTFTRTANILPLVADSKLYFYNYHHGTFRPVLLDLHFK